MAEIGELRPATTAASPGSSFVEWGAVIAGAAVATALSFVLMTFGTAIGLSATSPWPDTGASTKAIASLAVFWALVQQIGAFIAGGYVAGRMRSRWGETTEHEVEFRDGLHGALVWAVGVILSGALLLSIAGSVAKSGAEVAGRAAAAAGSRSDASDLLLDTMLRPATGQTTAASPAPASASVPATLPAPRSGAMVDPSRAEISRLLASSVTKGSITDPDRTYLAQLVSQRSGLPQPEAERRVNDAINQARDAADKARRAAVLTGFVTAASLIIALASAWWAAQRGGHHRDNSVPARFDFDRPFRRP